MLRRLLRDAKDLKNAIIFCNRKRDVAVVYKSLQKHGFSVGALHGDMDQSARTAALDQFRKGEMPLLVASDVAARGLDIPEVSHVFNFDVPHHPDDYVHRIGRTGRAGRTGTAISLVTPLDQKSIAAIEKLIGQSIPRAEGDFRSALPTPRDEAVRASRAARQHRGGPAKPQRGVASEGAAAQRREPRGEREATQAAPRAARDASHRTEPSRSASAASSEPRSRGQQRNRRMCRRSAAPSRAATREADTEPGDHSHLPAFLLRPVRARRPDMPALTVRLSKLPRHLMIANVFTARSFSSVSLTT